MEKEIKHTPLPYETNYTGNIWGDINNPEYKGDNPLIAEIYGGNDTKFGQANAEFIVRACNSHYELLDIIRDFISDYPNIHQATINEAKKRLAKAEGK